MKADVEKRAKKAAAVKKAGTAQKKVAKTLKKPAKKAAAHQSVTLTAKGEAALADMGIKTKPINVKVKPKTRKQIKEDQERVAAEIKAKRVRDEEAVALRAIETTEQSVAVTKERLSTLLKGAMIFANQDGFVPVLCAVLIDSDGFQFQAKATDRYRFVSGTVSAELKPKPSGLRETLVSLPDVKRILELLKEMKRSPYPVVVRRLGDKVTVSVKDKGVTFNVHEGTFPPTAHLLTPLPLEPTTDIAFNAKFMADFGKLQHHTMPLILKFQPKGKPIRVILSKDVVDWTALLMPMRYTEPISDNEKRD